jgi:4-azaleucine resistance transporter AzlC
MCFFFPSPLERGDRCAATVGEVSLIDTADFKQGLKDIAPMVLAYAPIAALWGTTAAAKGFSPFEATLMSIWVYSGATQFVATDLWATAPAVLLVFTAAIVSLRHVLMSASVSRHMAGFGKGRASFLLFWLTDEAWAMIERRAVKYPISPSYFFGVSFPLWPNWALFTWIGAMLGNRFGDGRVIGLDFAFAAMFIAVLAGFWKGPRTGAILVASSLAAIACKMMVPGAWYIIAGGVAGMVLAVVSYREDAK